MAAKRVVLSIHTNRLSVGPGSEMVDETLLPGIVDNSQGVIASGYAQYHGLVAFWSFDHHAGTGGLAGERYLKWAQNVLGSIHDVQGWIAAAIRIGINAGSR